MCRSLVSRHPTGTLAPFASSLCCAHRFIPLIELLKCMSTGIAMDFADIIELALQIAELAELQDHQSASNNSHLYVCCIL